MPTIHRAVTLEVQPERYVEACSEVELQELMILADARLRKLSQAYDGFVSPAENSKNIKWTPDRIALLRCMSAKEAATHFGVSAYTIHTARCRHGISKRQLAPAKPATPRRAGGEYDVNDNGALTGVML